MTPPGPSGSRHGVRSVLDGPPGLTHTPLAVLEPHRPRNLDWKRAAALLYGDWGTSKAYVIGLAFMAAGFSSLPIILAVCAVTALVGFNYAVVCRHFPDGGGVYAAAKAQGRLLAVIGALLLIADLTVTAALSGFSGLDYLPIDALSPVVATFMKGHISLLTIGLILLLGWLNHFGPKHSGSLAVALSLPTMATVLLLICLSLPHLTLAHLQPMHESLFAAWKQFVGVILALSGVEVIANLTGVMKLDPGATAEKPSVRRESAKAIWPVATEVVLGTALLGWAMLSLPAVLGKTLGVTDPIAIKGLLESHKADMLRFIGEQYAWATFQPWVGAEWAQRIGFGFGLAVGSIFFLLLLSAANAAIVGMIGVFYIMARDGEMPRAFTALNSHGVPRIPALLATLMPVVILLVATDFETLAGLYAIGVVGAITTNLGSCFFNRKLGLAMWEKALFGCTFVILFAVFVTLAHEKHDALFFVLCVLGIGLGLRAWAQKHAGLETITLPRNVADMVKAETIESFQTQVQEGGKILVAARGLTPVLKFAMDEAALRKASLCVLYVKEISVYLTAGPAELRRARWQDDESASRIMAVMQATGQARGVNVVPIYAVSDDPAATILDLAATLGVDMLILGASNRQGLTKVLKGDIATRVAHGLPEEIHLVICG